MRRRVARLSTAVLLWLPLATTVVEAQTHVRIGAFLGREFDADDDWLIFGAEGRIRGVRSHFDIQPRFHYRPGDVVDVLQLDGNILFNLDAPVSQIVPYMGIGMALNRISYDFPDTPGSPNADSDDTNIGLNFIMGLIFGTNPTWRPYAHFEYTSLLDIGNGANLSLGILWQISGRFR
jgi:hypothetical protein